MIRKDYVGHMLGMRGHIPTRCEIQPAVLGIGHINVLRLPPEKWLIRDGIEDGLELSPRGERLIAVGRLSIASICEAKHSSPAGANGEPYGINVDSICHRGP